MRVSQHEPTLHARFDRDVAGQYSVLTAFLNPGDEVIMFEPFFDQYLASIVFNGGVPVYVPLHPDATKPKPTSDDWKVDFDELRYVRGFVYLACRLSLDQTSDPASHQNHNA